MRVFSWNRFSGMALVGVLFFVGSLAGCMDDPDRGDAEPAKLSSLEVYEYRFQGDAVAHPDHMYGWMMRVTNQVDRSVVMNVEVDAEGATADWGPVDSEGWSPDWVAGPLSLEPGDSVLYLLRTSGRASALVYGVQVLDDEDVLEARWFNRTLERPLQDREVGAGDHVTTRTVGVWVNGTSFYTNIRGLNDDPGFPAGYDRGEFGGSDLRVYVYDEESSEQPPGSRDRCWFVTIPGYNELLKSQAEGTSNVRFLAPQEAYTREGSEDHDLYGDALVFLNRVVAHTGEVNEIQGAPQPTGGCFDPGNTVPLPDPPL